MSGNPERISGFTLLETLIYAALLGVIITFAVGTMYSIVQGSSSLNDKIVIEEEAHFLLRKIEWTLTGVETINIPSVGSSSSTLSVAKFNFSSNPVVIDLNGENVRIRRGTGSPAVLNSGRVAVGALTFTHNAAVGSAPAAIRVTLDIGGKQFETTIHLRR